MKKIEVPKPEMADHALTLVKGLCAPAFETYTTPYLGPVIAGSLAGGLTAALDLLPSPYQRRLEQFWQDITERVNWLSSKNQLDISELEVNELFQSIIIKSLRNASETHQEEKRDKLRNAVINTALKIDIKEDLQLIFIDCLNQLTLSHLKLLSLLCQYEEDVSNVNSYQELYDFCMQKDNSYIDVRKNEFRLLCHNLANFNFIIISDLVGDFELVEQPQLRITGVGDKKNVVLPKLLVTDIGHAFIRYISS